MILNRFLPTYQFSEKHSCTISAPPKTVLESVANYQDDTDPFFRFAIRLRELPQRLLGRSDEAAKPFGLTDFTVLARTDDAIVYGLVGQFWRMDFGLRPVADGAAFLAFNENGIAKLVLAFTVEADQQVCLVTETRVWCPDKASQRKFRLYWMLIRPVSGLIRRRMLRAVKRQCEGVDIQRIFRSD